MEQCFVMCFGMMSSSKIGGRMLRDEVSGPISADEKSELMWKMSKVNLCEREM